MCDEESSQNKALYFLASYVGLRMAVVPECCHYKWNCWKRAIEHSDPACQFDLMRLTIAANYSHGAKLTGERSSMRAEFLESYLEKQSDEYFLDISTEIALDRGLSTDDMDYDTCRFTLQDFLEAPSIRKRGDYVT